MLWGGVADWLPHPRATPFRYNGRALYGARITTSWLDMRQVVELGIPKGRAHIGDPYVGGVTSSGRDVARRLGPSPPRDYSDTDRFSVGNKSPLRDRLSPTGRPRGLSSRLDQSSTRHTKTSEGRPLTPILRSSRRDASPLSERRGGAERLDSRSSSHTSRDSTRSSHGTFSADRRKYSRLRKRLDDGDTATDRDKPSRRLSSPSHHHSSRSKRGQDDSSDDRVRTERTGADSRRRTDHGDASKIKGSKDDVKSPDLARKSPASRSGSVGSEKELRPSSRCLREIEESKEKDTVKDSGTNEEREVEMETGEPVEREVSQEREVEIERETESQVEAERKVESEEEETKEEGGERTVTPEGDQHETDNLPSDHEISSLPVTDMGSGVREDAASVLPEVTSPDCGLLMDIQVKQERLEFEMEKDVVNLDIDSALFAPHKRARLDQPIPAPQTVLNSSAMPSFCEPNHVPLPVPDRDALTTPQPVDQSTQASPREDVTPTLSELEASVDNPSFPTGSSQWEYLAGWAQAAREDKGRRRKRRRAGVDVVTTREGILEEFDKSAAVLSASCKVLTR